MTTTSESKSFGEILSEFKRNEVPEATYPLLEDRGLCNALVSWKSVPIEYKSPGECEETTDQKKWEWLWRKTKTDQNAFAVISGLKPQDAGRMLARLIGLRLIYPDGTINSFAKQFLSSEIVRRISATRALTKKVKKDMQDSYDAT